MSALVHKHQWIALSLETCVLESYHIPDNVHTCTQASVDCVVIGNSCTRKLPHSWQCVHKHQWIAWSLETHVLESYHIPDNVCTCTQELTIISGLHSHWKLMVIWQILLHVRLTSFFQCMLWTPLCLLWLSCSFIWATSKSAGKPAINEQLVPWSIPHY